MEQLCTDITAVCWFTLEEQLEVELLHSNQITGWLDTFLNRYHLHLPPPRHHHHYWCPEMNVQTNFYYRYQLISTDIDQNQPISADTCGCSQFSRSSSGGASWSNWSVAVVSQQWYFDTEYLYIFNGDKRLVVFPSLLLHWLEMWNRFLVMTRERMFSLLSKMTDNEKNVFFKIQQLSFLYSKKEKKKQKSKTE